MSSLNEYLENLYKELPEFLTTSQVVSLNIFGSRTTLTKDRLKNQGPPFVRFSKGRIRYPKDGLIRYLKEHYTDTEGAN